MISFENVSEAHTDKQSSLHLNGLDLESMHLIWIYGAFSMISQETDVVFIFNGL